MMTIAHQEDLTVAVKRFGDKNIILGNVEPALILEGSPDQVYEACRKAIEIGKKSKRGFALNSGCEISPETPPFNVWVMRKAIDDFGWY
jgi:uroporphyrinogen decarboxylase